MNFSARNFLRGLFVLSLCLFASASFHAQDMIASAAPAASPGSTLLKRVVEEYWQDFLKDDIYQELRTGARIDALPDLSEKKRASRAAFAQHILTELTEVKSAELSHEDLLTLELLQWQERQTIEQAKYYWLPFQITPYASPIPLAQRVYTEHRFRDKADLDHYVALLEKYPAFVHEIESHLHGQVERGIAVPNDEIPAVKGFLSAYLQAPEKNPLFVGQERLSFIDAGLVQPFQRKVAQIITAQVNPALQALLDYVSGEYAGKAPNVVGLSQYPMGKEYYGFLVRYYTTLDISPEEIHRIGLESVEAGEAKMAEIRRAIGFQGDREEFHRNLKSDPKFYVKTPEEVDARLMSYVSRVRQVVDSYFRKMPKAPYGVKRLDPALEGGQTFGHYDPPSASQPLGIYFFNGSHLSERSLYQAGPLILHELIPGHHFQLNLQAENQSLPEFRRQTWYPAYSEGWGDYSAKLGEEMGVYKDPYDLYALQAMDMFIAVRLVVDTGMNCMGWTRAKALEYMRQHDLEGEMQLRSESLRYSVDIPGQALAYKIGSSELLKLREKAKKALGDQFDIREFHDWILGSGSMPLSVLAQHVNWGIEQRKATQGAIAKQGVN